MGEQTTPGLLTAADAMAPYLTDWRGVYAGRAQGVARPGSTAEVAALVRWAAATGTPLVPQGGNTGLCGAATPDGSGRAVVVSFERMGAIREIDVLDGTVTVEAGCIVHTLRERVAEAGMLFPMELGSEGSARIGGLVSTNAGGVEALRHGPMRDLVLGLEVVLPDGRVLNGLRRLRKDNTGYDLKHLFIGSEGTLGLVTAAVLKLVPRPAATGSALCGMASPDAALALLGVLRARAGDRVAKFELACAGEVGLARAHQPELPGLAGAHPWYVFVELTDSDPAAPLATVLTEALADGPVEDALVAGSLAQEAGIWRLRHAIPEANRRAGPLLSHDVSVPVSRVPALIEALEQRLAEAAPAARRLYVGHVGDGNMHVVLVMPERPDAATAATVRRHVYDVVRALDGSISAEHGVGQALRDLLPDYVDPVRLALMRGIKTLLDPHGIMNPGKVLAAATTETA